MSPSQISNSSNQPYTRIPQELQVLRQWLCWKYVVKEGSDKPAKVPYQPNGILADAAKPHTWCSFEEAVAHAHRFSGIGFVFTSGDKYVGIDLDKINDPETQAILIEIFKRFDSYSEFSPSGNGLHIIIKVTDKTKILGGKRRGNVEMYSQERFFTFTGDVCNGGPKPIAERQRFAEILWEQLGGQREVAQDYAGDANEKHTDKEITQQALSASNSDLFKPLFEGRWKEARRRDGSNYPSQSEADFAFCDIVAHYTDCMDQVARIFRNSALGKVPKPGSKTPRGERKNYVMPMVRKAFDNKLPLVDITGLNEDYLQASAHTQALAPYTAAEISCPVCKSPAKSTAAGKKTGQDAKKELVIKCVDHVLPEHIRWLWLNRFALGKVSMVGGIPGLGKSQLMAKIAACVSTGTLWPDNTKCEFPGSVLMLSCEDDIADTIRPRLEAVHANLKNIEVIKATKDDDVTRGVSLIEHIDEIEKVIMARRDVRLLIIDPITAYLDRINTNMASEVRSALTSVQLLTETYDLSTIIVSHFFNKSNGHGNAINAFTGSTAFPGLVRTAFIVANGQEDKEGLRLFAQAKTNHTPAPTLAFRVNTKKLSSGIIAPYVEFEQGTVDVTADEILSSVIQGRKPQARNEAEEFLRKALEHGPVPANDVKEQAEAKGISEQTLRRTREALNIKPKKVGFGDKSERIWELPQSCDLFGIPGASSHIKH
jgi:hypothetical protein